MRKDSLEKVILKSSSDGNTIFKRLFYFYVFIFGCTGSSLLYAGFL